MSEPQFDLFICASSDAITRFFSETTERKSNASIEFSGPDGEGLYNVLYQGLIFEGWIPPSDDWPGKWVDSEAERIFYEVSPESLQQEGAFALRPGRHISSERPVPIILEKMLELASKIGANLEYTAVFWRPAQLITGAQYFAETIGQMASGGILPVLSLVDFRSISGNSHQTYGLAHFSGQEICLQTPEGMSDNDRVRRLVRLALDAIIHGPVTEPITAKGISSGEQVILQPEAGAARVLARTVFATAKSLN